jgi:hypothetical protein
MEIISISNTSTGEFFFSTDHCQSNLGCEWVPCSILLPLAVEPRNGLKSGLVETIEEYLMIFHKGEKQIPNPDPEYKPSYGLAHC